MTAGRVGATDAFGAGVLTCAPFCLCPSFRDCAGITKAFKSSLLYHLGATESEFEQEIKNVRHYRDKFVAHLDSEEVMHIPKLDIFYESVVFYYKQAFSEITLDAFQGFPLDFEKRYQDEVTAVRRIYESALATS